MTVAIRKKQYIIKIRNTSYKKYFIIGQELEEVQGLQKQLQGELVQLQEQTARYEKLQVCSIQYFLLTTNVVFQISNCRT